MGDLFSLLYEKFVPYVGYYHDLNSAKDHKVIQVEHLLISVKIKDNTFKIFKISKW